MGRRFLGTRSVMLTLLIVTLASAIFAQRPRPRPAATPANATGDFKIRYKSTNAGQTFESTMMVKGARQRSEMRMGYGMDIVGITQCDLKRTIQVGDKVKKYLITPMEVNSATAPPSSMPASSSTQPVRRGGLVTYLTSTTDTGERKEMFGLTARHIKSSLTIDSSPDACSPIKQRIDTDGWYVDLAVGFECDLGRPQVMAQPPVAPGGCRDRVEFKNVGTARRGYPLIETMTIYGPNGSVTATTTKEVVELTRETLDASLFDIPAGYSEAASSQELYSFGSTSDQTSMSQKEAVAQESTPAAAAATSKAPGTVRVGVVTINNRTDRDVSAEALRSRLLGNIQSNGLEAVPLNAISQIEAEAEARAKQCDFILYTDIATLKASTAKKIGGMFGRAAGISGVDKTEAKVEFRLFAVGETTPRLQSSASAKEEGDEVSAGTAIDQEARVVSAEVRKRSRN